MPSGLVIYLETPATVYSPLANLQEHRIDDGAQQQRLRRTHTVCISFDIRYVDYIVDGVSIQSFRLYVVYKASLTSYIPT